MIMMYVIFHSSQSVYKPWKKKNYNMRRGIYCAQSIKAILFADLGTVS